MKCPHCQTSFHDRWEDTEVAVDVDGYWIIKVTACPSCNRSVVMLSHYGAFSNGALNPNALRSTMLCRPKVAMRPAPGPDVSEKFARDFRNACLVMSDSAEASAALSRRCLQNVLRDVANAKPSDLAKEIQEVLDSGKLPSHLADSIDAIRNIGNFGAHPIKSKSSGEIVDVEPGEAEWNLDVLEGLFDFYFVQPALTKKKRDALNKKLADAGRPDMKAAAP